VHAIGLYSSLAESDVYFFVHVYLSVVVKYVRWQTGGRLDL